MNKQQIKKYARWILEDLEKAENNVKHWIFALVDELKESPKHLREKIEHLEEKIKKLEGK